MLVSPEEIDKRLGWPLGKSTRLARRGRLPHFVLPDGETIRFDPAEIEALIIHRPVPAPQAGMAQGLTHYSRSSTPGVGAKER